MWYQQVLISWDVCKFSVFLYFYPNIHINQKSLSTESMTIGSWYLERDVVYKFGNALGSVVSNPIMVYLWGYLKSFSNLGSCCFFFGRDSVAREENHNISHVSGHWLRTALYLTLTSQVICFLLSREACEEKTGAAESLPRPHRALQRTRASQHGMLHAAGGKAASASLCKPEPLVPLGKLKTAHSCDSLWF